MARFTGMLFGCVAVGATGCSWLIDLPSVVDNTAGTRGNGGSSTKTEGGSGQGASEAGGRAAIAGGSGFSGAGGVTSSGGTVNAQAGAAGVGTGGLTATAGSANAGGSVGGTNQSGAGGLIGIGSAVTTGGRITTGGGGGTAGTGGTRPAGGTAAGGTATGGSATGGTATGGQPSCMKRQETTAGANLLSAISTQNEDHLFTPSCGSSVGAQYVFGWTAPGDGWYALDTAGSNFDTVLAIRSPSCTSTTDLACNDNIPGASTSRIVRKFSKAESVLVAIGGNYLATGNANFSAQRVTCPSQDLTGAAFPVSLNLTGGTTFDPVAAGASATTATDCGGGGRPMRSYLWAPATAGMYTFTGKSPTIETSLYVLDGAICGSPLLGCNKPAGPSAEARVTRWLNAGQAVTLVIGADATQTDYPFTLTIAPAAGTCPIVNVGQVSDLDGKSGTLGPSGKEWTGISCSPTPSGFIAEDSYGFTVNLAGGKSCYVDITADSGNYALLMRGTQCSGPELDGTCTPFVNSTSSSYWARTFTPSDNGQYTLVIQGPWETGFGLVTNYSITSSCMQ